MTRDHLKGKAGCNDETSPTSRPSEHSSLTLETNMRIDIRATNIDLPSHVIEDASRRALFAFGRFAPRIRGVSMVVSDVNGPRGGVDTSCRVRVVGHDGWDVNVSDIDHDAARAVTCALGRAGRAVARRLDRLRDIHAPLRRQRRAS